MVDVVITREVVIGLTVVVTLEVRTLVVTEELETRVVVESVVPVLERIVEDEVDEVLLTLLLLAVPEGSVPLGLP